MKLKVILTASFSLILAMAVSAQDTKIKNFSGNWTLNTAKSKLIEDQKIVSMTLAVAQTGKELRVETKTKPMPRATAAGANTKRGGTMPGAGLIETDYNYLLDGKESVYKSTDGIDSAKMKALIEKDGNVKLSQTRRFNTPNGEMILHTVETWLLSADGKTLTVRRDADVIKGDFISKKIVTETSELIFTKNK